MPKNAPSWRVYASENLQHKTHLNSIILRRKNNLGILNAFLHTSMNKSGMKKTRIINYKPIFMFKYELEAYNRQKVSEILYIQTYCN